MSGPESQQHDRRLPGDETMNDLPIIAAAARVVDALNYVDDCLTAPGRKAAMVEFGQAARELQRIWRQINEDDAIPCFLRPQAGEPR